MATPLRPTISPDTAFFWDGLREHVVRIQRCVSCGELRHPPRPMCPSCNSLEWDTVDSSGRGTLHSFVMPLHPQFPFLDYPYIVALVDLAEGVRLVSNLVGIEPADARIDMPVEVCFAEFDGDLVLHQFRPREQA
ncbi:MAG: Zn-ribbon domain-containing OB-fold protein [Acidimicrobiia bacterium]|nr:Zn-ribbon domain-containing OB-fold protein [Acidimicrobiia bacterium]